MTSRTFLLIQHETRTDGDFSAAGVANNGRLDIGCRFINATLFTSYSLRTDVDAHLLFMGEPDPPVHMAFQGEKIVGLHPDERSIAGYIKKNMRSFEKRKVPSNPGVAMDKRGLDDVLEDTGKTPVVLDEEGEDIMDADMPDDPLFVLGDHRGLTEGEFDTLDDHGARHVSLCRTSYQAQQVASFLNIWMDRVQKG